MLEIAFILLGLFVISVLLEQYLKIPRTLTLLTVALVNNFLGISILNVNGSEFDSLILLLLPLFIAADAINLTLKELKDNSLSLLYTALISVVLSIFVAVLINKWIFPTYDIPTSALVMLFCMVLATDPITVTSVFSNFKLPHKLKIIAEGESLFNDAFALIIFFVALGVYKGGDLTAISLAMFSAKMIIGSVVIGFVFGLIALWLLQLTRDVILETAIILSAAYGSFILAEHFHLAGILAIIVSVLTAKTLIDKRIDEDENNITKEQGIPIVNFIKFKQKIVDVENNEMIKKFILFLASLSAVVLFLSMGEVISISSMIVYWKEIILIFIATSIIRALMMLKFALISNNIGKMKNISFHWWKVLTFAGVKGGLSILMVHLLPVGFEYKTMFEAVVFGNIILSTFIYSICLIVVINYNKIKFEKECETEH